VREWGERERERESEREHVDVIFHLRLLLRNMTSICLLILTFRKKRIENVIK